MATHNVTAVERLGSVSVEPRAQQQNASHRYQAPNLFTIGAAVDLVHGNQLSGTYRDATNSWYTYWSNL